ncbi:uncharacterized protein G2W53_035358 [Senna tora]|uniref:Retrotransposon Copia-like N-terminal domain-containing protein n=1 Tax=Senna tora TaxID=362788 RepID=A0A834SQ90_9FABA|nr:uncharacterized protein G2W53_035358 [Senna tora]
MVVMKEKDKEEAIIEKVIEEVMEALKESESKNKAVIRSKRLKFDVLNRRRSERATKGLNLQKIERENLFHKSYTEMEDSGNNGKTSAVIDADGQSKKQGNAVGGWVLHNSDQPRMTLVASQLTGPNYLSWSLAVKTALEAEDKLGFIDGSINQPEDPVEYKRWKPVDSMMKSWLMNSLTKDMSKSFMFCNSAKQI